MYLLVFLPTFFLLQRKDRISSIKETKKYCKKEKEHNNTHLL